MDIIAQKPRNEAKRYNKQKTRTGRKQFGQYFQTLSHINDIALYLNSYTIEFFFRMCVVSPSDVP